MAWKPEAETMLRRLWGEEKTASECAEEMNAAGHKVTRNMVIGKARRMGLQSRPSPIKRDTAKAIPENGAL